MTDNLKTKDSAVVTKLEQQCGEDNVLPQFEGRRLLLSEEGLKDEIGHWFEYCRSVSEIHRAAGVESVVLSHKHSSAAVRMALDVRPDYPETSWDGMNNEPRVWKRYLGILKHNAVVWQTVYRVLRRDGPFDLVFAPTTTIHHLIGWRLLAATTGVKSAAKFMLFFRNSVAFYIESDPIPRFKRSTQILSWILRSFKRNIESGRVQFATDSERIADEYEALSGIRPIVLPSPRIATAKHTEPTPKAELSETLIFSSLGPARLEKGIGLLQGAISEALKRESASARLRPLRFEIQWNSDIILEDGTVYRPDEKLRSDPRVTFITEPMSSAQYDAALHRASCLVLPYRQASYFARISGVAVEAATAGIPVIYTRGTWIETLINGAGAGIAVEDGDVSGLADAITYMSANIDAYQEQASFKSKVARDEHSSQKFLKLLWGMA